VNCSAIPETLLRVSVRHEKGSFHRRDGAAVYFELADGGTIFPTRCRR